MRARPLLPLARLAPLAVPLAALVVALAAGSVVLPCLGVNPLHAYAVMAKGAFGSAYSLSEVAVKATPLIFTGLAVALAATMLAWNIGAEGQLVWGGIFAAGTALFGADVIPAPLLLPAEILAGAAGGALWALVPAWLKARFSVNEIITTLLLNYVAIIFLEHLFYGPWRDPAGFGFPGTAMIAQAARLARLPGTRIHLGLGLALVLAALLWLLLARTPWGYRVRVMGQGPKAARYAGMDVGRHLLLVMALSGALAGLAGAGEVCGIHFRLQKGLAVGYGYDGIIVAWLARCNPLAVPLAALMLAALLVGGEQLQSAMGLPSAMGLILEGALLFGFLVLEALRAWRSATRPAKEAA